MADGHVPPQEVRSNAKRGLELRAKYNRGGTEVGVARARDLSNGKALSLDTIKRMVSYFARHEVDKKGEGWGTDSAGYIAWLLWGGDAGRAWANRIAKENEKKDKTTMADFANAYASIIKADKNDDGTLTVYGKATDDSLDMDSQICDPTWLDRAMPEWMRSGGNIREQHSNIAAGVAKELESKADGHYISVLVVDPVSVKKVETGVLKGFSIGIKSPRVVRDTKAANGRIIDGQIIEVSLVDRPANPNAKLIMAKSIDGEPTLVQVEELHEYKAPLPTDITKKETDYTQIIPERKGSPADKELYARVIAEAKKKFKVYPSAVANAWVVQEYKKRGGTYKSDDAELTKREFSSEERETAAERGQAMPDGSYPIKTEQDLKNAIQAFGRAKNPAKVKEHIIRRARALGATNLLPDDWKEAMKSVELLDIVKNAMTDTSAARQALAELLTMELKEYADGDDEAWSISALTNAIQALTSFEMSEAHEAAEGEKEMIEMANDPDTVKEADTTAGCECDGCAACKTDGGCDSKMCKMHKDAHKSLEKCLECGCHLVEQTHGRDDVSTATIVTPEQGAGSIKSEEADEVPAVTEEVTPEVSEDATSEETSLEDVIEAAVKSAMESVKAEIDALRAEKESAVEKSVTLESELATAKSLAVAGGPKRTANKLGAESNEYLVKAATYKAKAEATTDPVLAKGYKALYAEFSAKGGLTVQDDNE